MRSRAPNGRSRTRRGRSEMELQDYDPYPVIGGAGAFAKYAARTRVERDDVWRPVMDAFHTSRDLVLRFEIPGVEPSDVELRVDGRILYVQGVRRPPERDPVPAELTMRAEGTFGRFDRSIVLPEGTDPAGVRATYRHGVLEVLVAHVRRPAPTEVEPEVHEAGSVSIPTLET